MQKTKDKISQCPTDVEAIIKKANSVPFDFSFEDVYLPATNEEQHKRVRELAQTLPDSFSEIYPDAKVILNSKEPLEIVFPDSDESIKIKLEPIQLINAKIYTGMVARTALLQVVEWNKESINSETIKLKKEDIRYFGLTIENGVLTPRLEFPFDDLINQQIDTRRIKYCSECKNFSWAKRLNKNVENYICESCSNKLRQKRFVSIPKNKEEISKRRRIAYYRNKGIKILCEKCAYPHTKCSCYLKERSKK